MNRIELNNTFVPLDVCGKVIKFECLGIVFVLHSKNDIKDVRANCTFQDIN